MNERTALRFRVVRDYITSSQGDEEAKFLALEMLRLLEGDEPGIIDVATPDEIHGVGSDKQVSPRSASASGLSPASAGASRVDLRVTVLQE